MKTWETFGLGPTSKWTGYKILIIEFTQTDGQSTSALWCVKPPPHCLKKYYCMCVGEQRASWLTWFSPLCGFLISNSPLFRGFHMSNSVASVFNLGAICRSPYYQVIFSAHGRTIFCCLEIYTHTSWGRCSPRAPHQQWRRTGLVNFTSLVNFVAKFLFK